MAHDAENLRGGSPELWEEMHAGGSAMAGHKRFRTAPERAILDCCVDQTRLQRGSSFLELGCGGGRFLAEIACRTGASPNGVDFSPAGIAAARAELTRRGLPTGGLLLDTIEHYVEAHSGAYDAVVSFGLVEHFDALHEIVKLHFAAVRPGGRVFISAPNLDGVNLAWMQRFAPEIATWHRPLSARALAEALRQVGAIDIHVAYVGGPRLFSPVEPGGVIRFAAARAKRVVNGFGEMLMRVSPRVGSLGGRLLSGHLVASATRPELTRSR